MADAELASDRARGRGSGASPSTRRNAARARWWRRWRQRPRRSAETDGRVGHHSGGGTGNAHPAARLLEGAAAGRQPRGRARRGAAARRQRVPGRADGARRGGPHPVRHLAAEVATSSRYYGASYGAASIAYAVQERAAGLCDAIFRARALRAAGGAGDGRPARHHLVPGGRASPPARRPPLLPALSRGPPGVLRRGGHGRGWPRARGSGQAARARDATGSGAPSRCRARRCTRCTRFGRRATAGTSTSAPW